jgi:cytoskeletal protein RodZ
MPEIGETLREARMRRRIDMTEVETATKIRGKYLRALENEEWDLLPGPTFVKSFLRTYAEYLGLDARLLVEEYRQRYERPSTQDLTPFSAARRPGRPGRPRRARLAAAGPVLVIMIGALVLVGFFWVLGTLGQDDNETPSGPSNAGQAQPTATATPRKKKRAPAAPTRVQLRLEATGPVYVCLVDASGDQVIDEQTLDAGTRTKAFTSKSFRTNFGNDNVRMLVDGKTYKVAASADPIGYSIRPGRKPRLLSADARPDCSA